MSNFFDRRAAATPAGETESTEGRRELPAAQSRADAIEQSGISTGGPHFDYRQQESTASDITSRDDDADSATPLAVKRATQELLKHGYLYETQKRELFRNTIVHQRLINAALEPLDLRLRLDTHRGLAFLTVATPSHNSSNMEDTEWSHPLVRRQRLTLEQSLLVALLRQAFVIHEQEAGVGQSAAKVAVDDLLPQFLTYFQDSGSDAKNESRLLSLLDQLKVHGIVSEVDKQQEVVIRPLIAYLANPDSLAALLRLMTEQAEQHAADTK